jgi:hypothetical protein
MPEIGSTNWEHYAAIAALASVVVYQEAQKRRYQRILEKLAKVVVPDEE